MITKYRVYYSVGINKYSFDTEINRSECKSEESFMIRLFHEMGDDYFSKEGREIVRRGPGNVAELIGYDDLTNNAMPPIKDGFMHVLVIESYDKASVKCYPIQLVNNPVSYETSVNSGVKLVRSVKIEEHSYNGEKYAIVILCSMQHEQINFLIAKSGVAPIS